MRADLYLVMLGGLLGSSHCIGMCGGFALSIGIGAANVRGNVVRQLVYSLGRIFTYATLGSFAGFAGLWLAKRTTSLIHVQAMLSLIAGVVLIVQGLKTLGVRLLVIRKKSTSGGSLPSCMSGSLLSQFMRSPRISYLFIAGVLNGLLPCGLVYGYLALASSEANIRTGAATMAAFGLGTIPLMVATGAGASLLSALARKRLFQVAGLCVLITGCLAVERGIHFGWTGPAKQCPGCACETVEIAGHPR